MTKKVGDKPQDSAVVPSHGPGGVPEANDGQAPRAAEIEELMVSSEHIVDQADRDGHRVVLTKAHIARVSGLGPIVLDRLAGQGELPMSALVTHILELIGPPPGGDAEDLVLRAVGALSKAGLVKVRIVFVDGAQPFYPIPE